MYPYIFSNKSIHNDNLDFGVMGIKCQRPHGTKLHKFPSLYILCILYTMFRKKRIKS